MNGNYRVGLPVQASTFAKDIDFGIYVIHAAMFVIFALWSVFFVYLLIRYRRKEGVSVQREHMGLLWSLMPDAFILAFELLLVFLYAIPGWSRIKMNAPRPEDSNLVEIVAEQFNWNVRYPGPDGKFGRTSAQLIDFANPLGIDPSDPAGKDDTVSLNSLHIPLGKPTLARLMSKDVIHSFSIAEFRVKQDAVPGMRIPVWFTPMAAGTYEISCAQLCGVGHAIMRAEVVAEAPEDFGKWLAAASAPAVEAKAAAPIEPW